MSRGAKRASMTCTRWPRVEESVERRDDVPSPRLVVREYRAEQKQCPDCQHITRAAFPAGVQAPLQYGATVGAIAVYLVEQQLLPLARACEVMSERHGSADERRDHL